MIKDVILELYPTLLDKHHGSCLLESTRTPKPISLNHPIDQEFQDKKLMK